MPAFNVRPVSGTHVWRGPDLARRDDWMHRLPTGVIDDLDQVALSARARSETQDSFDFEAMDFPRLRGFLVPVRAALESGYGFALLQGIPVARYSAEELKVVLLVVGHHLGLVGPQAPRDKGIGEVMDVQPKDKHTYYFHVGGPLPMHMDPIDVVGLLAVRAAMEGGESMIVSSMAVHNEILRTRPDVLEILYRGYPNLRRRGGAGVTDYPCPVFADIGGDTICSYLPAPILLALRDGLMTLTDAEQEALDVLNEVAARPDLMLGMDIEPGDIQFLNNRHILHGRADYRDHKDLDRRRLLLRVWLTMKGWRKYPPSIPHFDVELETTAA